MGMYIFKYYLTKKDFLLKEKLGVVICVPLLLSQSKSVKIETCEKEINFPSSKINQKGSEFILRAKADLSSQIF